MKLTLNNIRELYRLNGMIRYNTQQKINKETVASHSYYVTLFTKMICDGLGVVPSIKLLALEFALVHDVPEYLMNDVTYDAKLLMPDIIPLLNKFEQSYLEQNFPETVDTAYGSEDERIVARLIVELADVYSVIQYSDNEISLGNSRFQEIQAQSRMRASKIIKTLEGWYDIQCLKIMIFVQ